MAEDITGTGQISHYIKQAGLELEQIKTCGCLNLPTKLKAELY